MKRTLQQVDPRSIPSNEPTPEPPWKRIRFPLDTLDKADRLAAAPDLHLNTAHSSTALGRFGAQIGLPIASHEEMIKDVARVLSMDDQRRLRLDLPAKKFFCTTPSLWGFSDLETRPDKSRLWRGTNELGGIGKALSQSHEEELERRTEPDQAIPHDEKEELLPLANPIKCICNSTKEDEILIQCTHCQSRQHLKCYYKRSLPTDRTHYCRDCSKSQSKKSGRGAVNRHGRKQSLIEVTSDIYVCIYCDRKFRRRKHVKRHVRSLHIMKMPVGCNKCGMGFSHTDNLASHKCKHGESAITMGALENGHHENSGATKLRRVVFDAASCATEDSSEESSSDLISVESIFKSQIPKDEVNTLDEQFSRQANDILTQSQILTSKKNSRSSPAGRSPELFVSYTISQDLTSESRNQSNILCALKSRPRKIGNRNTRSAEKSGWISGAHTFPKSLSRS